MSGSILPVRASNTVMTKHPVQITSPVRNTFRTDTPFIPVITIMETRAAFSPDERYAIHPRSSKITAVRSSLISHSVVSIFRPQNADAINRKIRNMPCPSYKPTPLANKSVPKNRQKKISPAVNSSFQALSFPVIPIYSPL